MIVAPPPKQEEERIAALRDYQVLDTLAEQAYDDITYLAARVCDTPIALVSLVDDCRQWFKSKVGLDASETSRDVAFCAHAIHNPDSLLVVPDAASDPRFSGNPLVTGDPHIRFYAGAPLKTSQGYALGTLCVIDRRPRDLGEEQRAALRALARQGTGQLELRRIVVELERRSADLLKYQERLERYQKQLEEANARLATLSRTDPLTGLANRAACDERLDEELLRFERYRQSLAFVLLDVDHFKAFNDEFGHSRGDAVLRAVGRLLQESCRATDLVARYGGEEFGVILPTTGLAGATILAERFRRMIEATPWGRRPVTVSVGVAVASDAACDRQALVDATDRALYEAKRQGRNRVVESSAEAS